MARLVALGLPGRSCHVGYLIGFGESCTRDEAILRSSLSLCGFGCLLDRLAPLFDLREVEHPRRIFGLGFQSCRSWEPRNTELEVPSAPSSSRCSCISDVVSFHAWLDFLARRNRS